MNYMSYHMNTMSLNQQKIEMFTHKNTIISTFNHCMQFKENSNIDNCQKLLKLFYFYTTVKVILFYKSSLKLINHYIRNIILLIGKKGKKKGH
jgi:hypothetical protein